MPCRTAPTRDRDRVVRRETIRTFHAIEAGAYVRLTVSDTGTGMSQEVAARAFEPFFTTKPTGQGTGLGLATIYGIVTRTGGAVTISSEVGAGTTIRVDFPATSDASAAPRSVMPDVPLARGETVLLVEDEDIVREPVGRMLARSGYHVLSAPSATEALVIVREYAGEMRPIAHRCRDAGWFGQCSGTTRHRSANRDQGPLHERLHQDSSRTRVR